MQRYSMVYSNSLEKTHIDLLLELMWMGNHSRKSMALILNVHYVTISDWLCGINKPMEHNLKTIEEEHQKAFNSLKSMAASEYIGAKL